MNRCTVIAEPGTTWRRDIGRALGLIDAVAAAGADGIKFQYCSDPERLARRRDAGDYLTSYYDLKFNESWHAQLADRCQSRGISYACTVYLPEDVDVIARFVTHFKIAAFEVGAEDVLRAVGAAAGTMPVVISLGMGARLADVTQHDAIANPVFLHCVSAYPAPFDELNLDRIREDLDGFSDHTSANDPDALNVGALAVMVGARWIERHVMLPETPTIHPDWIVSFTPEQFAEYVRRIRVAERARGDGSTGSTPAETPMLRYRARTEPEDEGHGVGHAGPAAGFGV